MSVTLPSSPNKYYLSGMDWVMQALDYDSRKKVGCGNHFSIYFRLQGSVKPDSLQKKFVTFIERIHLLGYDLSRDLNLAPYWKKTNFFKKKKVSFKWFPQSSEKEFTSNFIEELNIPFHSKDLPVRCVGGNFADNTWIGFIFDHCYFDAKGAELFLRSFDEDCEPDSLIPSPTPARLNEWKSKFAAGKRINRDRLACDSMKPIRSFKSSQEKTPKNLFRTFSYEKEKTKLVKQRAEACGGPFMFLPYILAKTIQSVADCLDNQKRPAGNLTVPVTRDMRQPKDHDHTLFFNHLSFLNFRILSSDVTNFKKLVNLLKTQMYEQIKERYPEALAESSYLMRIVPKFILSSGLSSSESENYTVSFALLGESLFSKRTFLENPIEALTHFPRVPASPGVGVFVTEYDERLTITLSYLNHRLNEQEADLLIDRIVKNL